MRVSITFLLSFFFRIIQPQDKTTIDEYEQLVIHHKKIAKINIYNSELIKFY